MIRKYKDGVEWLEFKQLQPYRVKHGVFLRKGGVSLPPYDSLNTSYSVGDDEAHVTENCQKIKRVMALDTLMMPKQVHGIDIVVEAVGVADGIIATTKGVGIGVKQADCQAAIFYDPKQHVVATIHAGWRGQVQNIYGIAVEKLVKEFGVKREDLLVSIGPSLGPCHGEFLRYRDELPSSFWPFQEKPNYFNLWKVAEMQLQEAGIKHVEMARICTHDKQEDFFSYRRDKTTGRNATVAVLL